MKTRTIFLILLIVAVTFLVGFPSHDRKTLHADEEEVCGIVRSSAWFPFVCKSASFTTGLSVSGNSEGLPEGETPEFWVYLYDMDGVCTYYANNPPKSVEQGPCSQWVFPLSDITATDFAGSVLILSNIPELQAGGIIMDLITASTADASAIIDYGICGVNPSSHHQIQRRDGCKPPTESPAWYSLDPDQTEIAPSLHHTTMIFPYLYSNTPAYDTGFAITNSYYNASAQNRTATLYLYDVGGVLRRKVVVDMDSSEETPGVFPGYAATFWNIATCGSDDRITVTNCNGGFQGTLEGHMIAVVNIPYARGYSFTMYASGGNGCDAGYPATINNDIWGVDGESGTPEYLPTATLPDHTSIIVPYVSTIQNYQTLVQVANTIKAEGAIVADFVLYNMNGEHKADWTRSIPQGDSVNRSLQLIINSGSITTPGISGDSITFPTGFVDGWLLIRLEAPGAYAVENIVDTTWNAWGMTNCIIDNDIIGVSTEEGHEWEPIRANPLPADLGDTFSFPVVTEDPYHQTYLAIVNTCPWQDVLDLPADHTTVTLEEYGQSVPPPQTQAHCGPTTVQVHAQENTTPAVAPGTTIHVGTTLTGSPPVGSLTGSTSPPNSHATSVSFDGDSQSHLDIRLTSQADTSSQGQDLPRGLCFFDEEAYRFDPADFAVPRPLRATVEISETLEYNAETGQLHVTGTVTDLLKPITEVTLLTNNGISDDSAVPGSNNPAAGPYVSDFDLWFDFPAPQEDVGYEVTVFATNVTGASAADTICFTVTGSVFSVVTHENNADALSPVEYFYVSPFLEAATASVTFESKIGDYVYDTVAEKPIEPTPYLGMRGYATGPVQLIECYTDTPPAYFDLDPEVRARVLFWKEDSCTTVSTFTSPQGGVLFANEPVRPPIIRLNVPVLNGSYLETQDDSASFLPGQSVGGAGIQQIEFDFDAGTVTPQTLQVYVQLAEEEADKVDMVRVLLVKQGDKGTTHVQGYTGNVRYEDQEDTLDFSLTPEETTAEATKDYEVTVDEQTHLRTARIPLYCFDTGGLAVLEFTFYKDGKPVDPKAAAVRKRFPKDNNNDRMSDEWERGMADLWNTRLAGIDPVPQDIIQPKDKLNFWKSRIVKDETGQFVRHDPELQDPDLTKTTYRSHASKGDNLGPYDEYRGYILSTLLVGNPLVPFVTGFCRLTPVDKDLLVEVDNMASHDDYTKFTDEELVRILSEAAVPYENQLGVKIHYLLDDLDTAYSTLPVFPDVNDPYKYMVDYVKHWRDCKSVRLGTGAIVPDFPARGAPGNNQYEFYNEGFVHLQFVDTAYSATGEAIGSTDPEFRGTFIRKRECTAETDKWPNCLNLYQTTRLTVAHELFHCIEAQKNYHNTDTYDCFTVTYAGTNNHEYIALAWDGNPSKLLLMLDQDSNAPYDHSFDLNNQNYGTIEKLRKSIDDIGDGFSATYDDQPNTPDYIKNMVSPNLVSITTFTDLKQGPVKMKRTTYSIMCDYFYPASALQMSFDWAGNHDDVSMVDMIGDRFRSSIKPCDP